MTEQEEWFIFTPAPSYEINSKLDMRNRRTKKLVEAHCNIIMDTCGYNLYVKDIKKCKYFSIRHINFEQIKKQNENITYDEKGEIEHVFPFGQHKGHTVYQVYHWDPNYLKWCLSVKDKPSNKRYAATFKKIEEFLKEKEKQ